MNDFRPTNYRMNGFSQRHDDSVMQPNIPKRVLHFTDLIPLDKSPSAASSSSVFGLQLVTSVFKATNMMNGELVCLRRIHAYQLRTGNINSLMHKIDSWKWISHPNLVPLKQWFTTKDFGDSSLMFVYDFIDGADTMMNHHFANTNGFISYSHYNQDYYLHNSPRRVLPESLLWNYIIQMLSAVRTIHASGLAFRILDPTKILVTENLYFPDQPQQHLYTRLRLNCCGIFDVVNHDNFSASFDSPKAMTTHFQQDDLTGLGKICMALACSQLNADQPEHLQQSINIITRNYSNELVTLIKYLLDSGSTRSIEDTFSMIGGRFYNQIEMSYQREDLLNNRLVKQLDNGRFLRLMVKLGIVNERPGFTANSNWSDDSNKYYLKLFRDYLFHQNDASGRPFLDLAHIVTALNKLDAGSPERICLVSQDQEMIIVSFAELKQYLMSATDELLQ